MDCDKQKLGSYLVYTYRINELEQGLKESDCIADVSLLLEEGQLVNIQQRQRNYSKSEDINE